MLTEKMQGKTPDKPARMTSNIIAARSTHSTRQNRQEWQSATESSTPVSSHSNTYITCSDNSKEAQNAPRDHMVDMFTMNSLPLANDKPPSYEETELWKSKHPSDTPDLLMKDLDTNVAAFSAWNPNIKKVPRSQKRGKSLRKGFEVLRESSVGSIRIQAFMDRLPVMWLTLALVVLACVSCQYRVLVLHERVSRLEDIVKGLQKDPPMENQENSLPSLPVDKNDDTSLDTVSRRHDSHITSDVESEGNDIRDVWSLAHPEGMSSDVNISLTNRESDNENVVRVHKDVTLSRPIREAESDLSSGANEGREERRKKRKQRRKAGEEERQCQCQWRLDKVEQHCKNTDNSCLSRSVTYKAYFGHMINFTTFVSALSPGENCALVSNEYHHYKACVDNTFYFEDKGTPLPIYVRKRSNTRKSGQQQQNQGTDLVYKHTERPDTFFVNTSGLYAVHVNISIVDDHHTHYLGLYLNDQIMMTCERGGFLHYLWNTEVINVRYRICNINGLFELNKGDRVQLKTMQAKTTVRVCASRSSLFHFALLDQF